VTYRMGQESVARLPGMMSAPRARSSQEGARPAPQSQSVRRAPESLRRPEGSPWSFVPEKDSRLRPIPRAASIDSASPSATGPSFRKATTSSASKGPPSTAVTPSAATARVESVRSTPPVATTSPVAGS
jgi:hypothetical protein